jgi:hypothetical protein
MKAKRAPGVIVTESTEAAWNLGEEAKAIQRQKQEAETRAAERREHRYNTMPNRICYAESAFKDWQPGDPIPECNVCQGKLYPEEHHNCTGYRPRYRNDGLLHYERMEMRKAGWEDWDDDQYDPTTPDETTHNLRMRHEAETGETYDQVVIEGMTEEQYLMRKFGYIPNFEDFEE